MATFKGIVTYLSQVKSGTSKAGKAWSKIDVVLTYDNSKPEYPKAIVFSVMNDNIGKFNLVAGNEYEVEVDFSVREYQGKNYMSASCWKAALTNAATQPATSSAPQTQPAQASPAPDNEFPF